MLAELHESGTTICMVTHDTRFAQHAKRVIYVFDGRVVDRDTALAAHAAAIETNAQ